MAEVEETSVVSEIATPETQNHEVVSEAPVQKAIEPEESRQDRNWKAARQKQKDLERELQMQREINERLLQMTSQSQRQQEVVEVEDPDDEFIPKGKVKKIAQKQLEPVEKRLQDLEKKIETQKNLQFIDNLKRQYSDFDEIVNPETLSILEQQEPELAETISSIKDPYKFSLQCYIDVFRNFAAYNKRNVNFKIVGI